MVKRSESIRRLPKHPKNRVRYLDNGASDLLKKAWRGQQLPLIGPGWAHFVYGGKMSKVKLGAAGLVEHGTVGFFVL